MTIISLLSAVAGGIIWAGEEPPQQPFQPTCRIHTDSGNFEYYQWRNAYTPTSSSFATHEYAVCSNGKGPWNWTASGVTVDMCAAKCKSLNCKCFDYMCDYHEAANCTCPIIPPVHPKPGSKKVACVGDSITAGYLSSCNLNYPGQLQTILGDGYNVSNYGVGGTTLLKKGDHPYWATAAFLQASKSNADIVVLMLGTNDAKKNNWDAHSADYPGDYKALIDVFRAMPSKPEIYIMVPPPLYRDGRYNMLQEVINTELPRLVPQVAVANRLPPPVDLFGLYQAHCPIEAGTPGHPPNATDVPCDWIGSGGIDACHPDNYGYGQVAKAVAAAISHTV